MFKFKMSKTWNLIKRYNTPAFLIVAFLWVGILVSTNFSNHQNLQRNDLSKSIKSIEDELRLLNANVSELQTTQRIENESKRLELVKVQSENIYYLDDEQGKVALR